MINHLRVHAPDARELVRIDIGACELPCSAASIPGWERFLRLLARDVNDPSTLIGKKTDETPTERTLSASRSGVRDTPKWSQRRASGMRLPGLSSP